MRSTAAYDVIGFQAVDLELCYVATNWVHVNILSIRLLMTLAVCENNFMALINSSICCT